MPAQPATCEPIVSNRRNQSTDGDGVAQRPATSGIRVALYSHDTMGLGHLRRNLLIAEALAGAPVCASTLLISGAHEANFFHLPDRADFLTLPRMHKDVAGEYSAGQLELTLRDLARLRGSSICSALEVFQPELFIVDKVPTGAADELLPALQMLASRGRTKCVLGLRDVLDDPPTVAREWLSPFNREVIERYFDMLWIYGDPRVYDPIVEYALPDDISRRVAFTGYLDQTPRVVYPGVTSHQLLDRLTANRPLIACLVGGGQDGAAIARTFVRALPRSGVTGVVLAGPFMPSRDRTALVRLAAANSNVHILDFVPEADLLIQRADRVVAMAGYNTVCSLLSFGKKALLVPRVAPRVEQRIRAQRLHQLGLVDMILPQSLSARAMRNWMTDDSVRSPDARQFVDLGGLSRLTSLTCKMLSSRLPVH